MKKRNDRRVLGVLATVMVVLILALLACGIHAFGAWETEVEVQTNQVTIRPENTIQTETITIAEAIKEVSEPVENISAENEIVDTVKKHTLPPKPICLEFEGEKEEQVVLEKEMDEEEFKDFCRLTYAESGLEKTEGQIAVAAVILNRQESSIFPDTFYGVMNQQGQFSSVRKGQIYIATANPYVIYYEDIPQKTRDAAQRALDGEDPTEQLLWDEAVKLGLDPVKYAQGGALYFYNPYACSEASLKERDNIKVKVRIGNHIFYKVWDQ